MNSLIDKNGKYIGQYLHIKDSEFSVRMFTKFYNLAIHNDAFAIDHTTSKDLIHAGKYSIMPNAIYVDDPDSDNNILKSISVGDYMVFLQESNKLYLFNKSEFKRFMNENKYEKDLSFAYVLGLDDGIEFKNMHIILSNTLDNAINIYKNRYNTEVSPICLGMIKDEKFHIYSDKHKISVPLVL